jgi:alpha-galactosidase
MYGAPVPAETWFKDLADGSYAAGFFNRTNQTVRIDVPWRDLGFQTPPEARDVWLHRDLGEHERYTAELPPHGCALLRVKAFLGTRRAER